MAEKRMERLVCELNELLRRYDACITPEHSVIMDENINGD